MSNFGFTVLGFGSGSSGIAEAIPAGTIVTDSWTTSYMGWLPFEATGSKFYIGGHDTDGEIHVCSHTGNEITIGAEQFTLGTGNCCFYSNSIDIDHNTGSKGLVVYVRGNASNGYYIYATAFTVSGDTMTFGTQAVIDSNYSYTACVTADPNNADKYFANWRIAAAGGNHHAGCIITLSGTTISKGTTATIHSGGFAMGPSIAWDKDTANSLVFFSDAAASPDAIAATVSGTTLTVGSAVNVEGSGNATNNNGVFFVSAGKCVFGYKNGVGTATPFEVVIGTVSGTGITLGTPSVVKSSTRDSMAIALDPNNPTKMAVIYGDGSDSTTNVCMKVGEIDVAGDSFTWGDEYIVDNNWAGSGRINFDPDPAASGKFVASFFDGDNSDYATFFIGQIAV